MKEYKFKINQNIIDCLNVAINSDDLKEIYHKVKEAIRKTLTLNNENGFSFIGFYPSDSYIVGHYKEMMELQDRETDPVLLLMFILVNRSSTSILIKNSEKLNPYEFVLTA